MSTHVHKVLDVDAVVLRTSPGTLLIRAIGQVQTAGWRNPRLEPRYYIQFPPDGIQDFDFVADPPTGMSAQVISFVPATYTWPGMPQALKGVRVHASANWMEALLSGARAVTVTM